MIIVVPKWEDKISPVFDNAVKIKIFEIEKSKIARSDDMYLAGLSLCDRIELFHDLKIEMIICGAITKPCYQNLTSRGIRIISFVTGKIDEVIKAYLSGEDIAHIYCMPGSDKTTLYLN